MNDAVIRLSESTEAFNGPAVKWPQGTKVYEQVHLATRENAMAKFRKKPVVIEAIQFTGNFDEIEAFVGGDAEFRGGELLIATLEGPLRAAPKDWIIKGVKGEFYPCKPDIFEATYELVTSPDQVEETTAVNDQ